MKMLISGMDIIGEAANIIWWFLPAIIADGGPVWLKIKGKHPMDFGKNFVDGKRILGNNKTWEGFLLGAFIGLVLGGTQQILGREQGTLVGFLMGVGALSGDATKSFFKRSSCANSS